MSTKKTKITVGIPTYNRAGYLTEAIASVLSQSFTDFELLVVDNCSQDDTLAVIRKIMSLDSRVRYIQNGTNLGMVGNWKKVVENTTTPYIKFLMDDDLFLPDCLLEFSKIVDKYPDCGVVASLGGKFFPPVDIAKMDNSIYVPSKVIPGLLMAKYLNVWTNQIGCLTNVLFKRDALERVLWVWDDVQAKWAPDFEVVARVIRNTSFYCINKPLVAVRVHSASQTSSTDLPSMHAEEERLFSVLSELAGNGFLEREMAYTHIARSAYNRFVISLRSMNFNSARYFYIKWWLSPKRLAAMQMSLEHQWENSLLMRIFPKIKFVLRKIINSRVSLQVKHLRFRYRKMESFWQ